MAIVTYDIPITLMSSQFHASRKYVKLSIKKPRAKSFTADSYVQMAVNITSVDEVYLKQRGATDSSENVWKQARQECNRDLKFSSGQNHPMDDLKHNPLCNSNHLLWGLTENLRGISKHHYYRMSFIQYRLSIALMEYFTELHFWRSNTNVDLVLLHTSDS